MFGDHRTPADVAKAIVGYMFTLGFVAIVNSMVDVRGIQSLSQHAITLPDVGHSVLPFIPEMARLGDTCLVLLYVVMVVAMCTKQAYCDLLCEFVGLHAGLLLLRCLTVSSTLLPSPMVGCATRDAVSRMDFSSSPPLLVPLSGTLTAWCHDLMYSGHTVVYALASLFIFDLHTVRAVAGAVLLIAVIGILCLLVARLHYTVDVLVALIITILAYTVRRPKILLYISAPRRTVDIDIHFKTLL